MTEKLKKLSYNSSLLLIVALVFPLVVFFLFATFLEPAFFIFLAGGLIVSLFFLISLRSHLLEREATNRLQLQHLEEEQNLVAAEAQQEDFAIQSLREKIVNYEQLKVLTERLSMCLYLEDTSKALSEEVNKLFGGEDTTIILYLFQSKTGELGISASHKGQMRVNIKSKKGDIFDQWIVRTMQPLLVEDVQRDYRFDIDKLKDDEDARPVRSLISVPLMVGNTALGILRVDSTTEKHFSTEDLRFLTTMGDLGAVAIENAQLFEHAEQLAIKDGLTDLYLRRYLLDCLVKEMSRHIRSKGSLSFLMIDLDHFKGYNDSFGHIAGDIVLRTLGMLLTDFFKEPGTIVSRYGGEEFAVLLPDCTKERARALADELRKKIEAQTIILRRQKTHITISVGVATFPDDAQIKNELIHKADQALYQAKNTGRNKVCVVT